MTSNIIIAPSGTIIVAVPKKTEITIYGTEVRVYRTDNTLDLRQQRNIRCGPSSPPIIIHKRIIVVRGWWATMVDLEVDCSDYRNEAVELAKHHQIAIFRNGGSSAPWRQFKLSPGTLSPWTTIEYGGSVVHGQSHIFGPLPCRAILELCTLQFPILRSYHFHWSIIKRFISSSFRVDISVTGSYLKV